MVGVGGVADDALVLLVEGVHRSPGERDAASQLAGVVGQGGVLPCSVDDTPVADATREPIGIAEVGVLRGPVLADEDAGSDVGEREERDRVAAGLVEQKHILAVGDPLAGQLDAQPPTKGLGEQQSLRERLGSEEAAHRRAAQRALLPGQSHGRVPFVLGEPHHDAR